MVGNGAKFGSLTRWGVQALAKRMRQRKGAKICLFNAAARQVSPANMDSNRVPTLSCQRNR